VPQELQQKQNRSPTNQTKNSDTYSVHGPESSTALTPAPALDLPDYVLVVNAPANELGAIAHDL